MNKNETLARCRLLWCTMLRHKCTNKSDALEIIYGTSDPTYPIQDSQAGFYHHCPLCEYCRIQTGTDCSGCINWSGKRSCDKPGATYFRWTDNSSPKNIKAVIATIDRAIKKLDETGEWK